MKLDPLTTPSVLLSECGSGRTFTVRCLLLASLYMLLSAGLFSRTRPLTLLRLVVSSIEQVRHGPVIGLSVWNLTCVEPFPFGPHRGTCSSVEWPPRF